MKRGIIDETVFELTKLQNEDVWNIILDYKFTKNKDHHGRYFELTKDEQ